MGCCSDDGVQLVERCVRLLTRAAQATAVRLPDVLKAREGQPIHLLAHVGRDFFATRVDILDGPRLLGVFLADLIGASAEELEVVQ